MSQYKENKDVALHLCTPYRFTVDGQGQVIQIGVYRYADGEPKIGIQRKLQTPTELKPSKLGRLTLHEARYIVDRLPEAMFELIKILDKEAAATKEADFGLWKQQQDRKAAEDHKAAEEEAAERR